MSKTTYYIVQTAPQGYVRYADAVEPATQFFDQALRLNLQEARLIWRTACEGATPDTPLRFPRIVKVTVETKTIKDRR
ncbi:MAG: hypothetical protein IJG13_20230 [Kiritimatiellae bacterium]|jgi:hypothetical protein|nr:hypothetical protein [Kiritimatiellia bacterium]MBQ6330879.1 hypothetical protein [Kiritimatiellia bacterium]